MKGMKRTATLAALLIQGALLQAQHIAFDPGNWETKDIAGQKDASLTRVNMMHVDTFYVEDLSTGEMTAIPGEPTLIRMEFDPVTGRRLRRIDIRQETRIDSMHVENIQTGEMTLIVRETVMDIPNGAYAEYHPDGAVRISGMLNGFDDAGEPRKTGEWIEWNTDRRALRVETYP